CAVVAVSVCSLGTTRECCGSTPNIVPFEERFVFPIAVVEVELSGLERSQNHVPPRAPATPNVEAPAMMSERRERKGLRAVGNAGIGGSCSVTAPAFMAD